MLEKESCVRSGKIVLDLAQQMNTLDGFFAVQAKNPLIKEFLQENRQAVYVEIVHRIVEKSKCETFGAFEPLMDAAIRFATKGITMSNETQNIAFYSQLFKLLKTINKQRLVVNILIKVTRQHGTNWIPIEYKRTVGVSLFALPILFVVYESMRASIIVALLDSNVAEFTSFILGLYVVIAAIGFIQEQKLLQQKNAVVFNPYSNLLALGLSTTITSIVSRAPRHLAELSGVLGVIQAKQEVGAAVVSSALAIIITATIWGTLDVVSNSTQLVMLRQEKEKK